LPNADSPSLDYATGVAIGLVFGEWAKIERVAEALLDRGIMGQDEFMGICVPARIIRHF
jgi:hypothetical protein